MHIGTHVLRNNLFVAPMAGVTDRPFRKLCKRFGAGLAVSEMVASNPGLRATEKSRRRVDHRGEPAPVAVQIAGADPAMMADAARDNAGRGAQIIDINMGCPAKKVCNKAAGSALLRDEELVARILDAVVAAVEIPVTLKIRTGWDPDNRNALRIARIATEAGVQLLAIHGRTRACGFGGEAEYDTIRAVKAATRLPVVANGDIGTPEGARQVLDFTGADGVMIGRAAQGSPWIFREIEHFLATGERLRRHPRMRSAMRCSITSSSSTNSTGPRPAFASRGSISPGTRSASRGRSRSGRRSTRSSRATSSSPRLAATSTGSDSRTPASRTPVSSQENENQQHRRTSAVPCTPEGGCKRERACPFRARSAYQARVPCRNRRRFRTWQAAQSKTQRGVGGMRQTSSEIAETVRKSLERYFKDLDGERPRAIYDMVLKNVEKPMLETVLGKASGNQTIAAEMLGINRNTLRKKISQHKIKV